VRAKFECRTCGRRFGSVTLFDAHLEGDAALQRGIDARLRGQPSQEGHREPKGGILDPNGIWRRPDPGLRNPVPAGGLLAGLAPDEEEA
jgi:hypothetical protein